MSSPSSEDLAFGPGSTSLSSASPPEHGCHCHPMGNLERLPLLHAVLDRAAGSFIGRAFALLCQIAVSLSAILLPTIILQKAVTIFECIDCIGFLLICCIEVLLPSFNRLIWGDVGHIPQICCDRSRATIAPRRRSSFGMRMVFIVAGFDIRLILVSVQSDSSADTIQLVLPPAYTFRSRRSFPPEAEKKQSPERPAEKIDECKAHLADFMVADEQEEEEEGGGGDEQEEEGDESLSPVRVDKGEPNGNSPQVQMEIPPMRNNLAPPHVPTRISSKEQLSSMIAKDARAADGKEGLRRTSMTDKEGQNLITVSSTVTSRLHQHRLRRCATCAQRQKPGGQPRKLIKKQQRRSNEPTEKVERPTAMYHRSLFWIKKEEDRRPRLQG